ncbi:MAG: cardiolipin synthase ClsB [Betaproteobacteria bacterium HGW-Betaproteobacteria-1]|jgi:cardiolipin synthase|nr:MAG: cardiolipin synthase ClsB [Betaproteobacteria bacterium HGW-Betaproteobacteria-1]
MIHFTDANQIELLRNGVEYFPALEAAINEARHEIYLETYIYETDATGLRIGETLKRAVGRGVRVYVLLDGFGCKDMPAAYIKELQEAGVNLMVYRPKISPWTLKRSRLRRLHRKLAVIDGKVAFVGGINIIDDFNVPNHDPPRIDYAVKIEGELLPQIRISARKLWRRIAWAHLRHVDAGTLPVSEPVQAGNMKAAFIVRDNLFHRRDIEESYLAAIKRAKTEVLIANAYFIPGLNFRKALIAAARRGVRVRLLLQGKKEYFLMFATHYFYYDFLAEGIQIYEYRKSFMHSKVAVIDHEWATVGSSNIDAFSLLLAREANIVVLDKPFAGQLASDIECLIVDGAHEILAEDWKRGNYLKRMLSALVYFVVRMVTGLAVQPDKH